MYLLILTYALGKAPDAYGLGKSNSLLREETKLIQILQMALHTFLVM